MTAKYTEAIDAMFALFLSAWTAGSAAIVGSVPEVRWQGVESPLAPVNNGYWCRVSAQNVLERQSTYKTGVAPNENRRYTSSGLLIVQIFCPTTDAQAMDKGRQLAMLVRDAFRGKSTANDVWFRNARINELSPEMDAYRFNVVVDYSYDDIG